MGNEDSHGLLCLIFEADYLNTLQNLYQWSVVGPDDVDEPKYLVSKKLSEVQETEIAISFDCVLTLITDGLLRGRLLGRRKVPPRHYAPLRPSIILQLHDQYHAAPELDSVYSRTTSLV